VICLTDVNQVAIMWNNMMNSSDTLTFSVFTINVGSAPYDVGLADMNNDGKVDICLTNNGANTISILVNQGINKEEFEIFLCFSFKTESDFRIVFGFYKENNVG
jgi:hypothetical protein